MATFPLRVIKRRIEATNTASLWLSVPSDLKHTFAYRPGQFVTIEAEIGGETLARQYSLSSSPGDEDLRITVKKIPGGRMSSWLVDEVEINHVLSVAPPRGRFLSEPEAPHHILLFAAGSGIAPIAPIARHLAGNHEVTIIYGNRSRGDIALHEDVRNLGVSSSNAMVELALTRPDDGWDGLSGRINADFIAARYNHWCSGTRSDLPKQIYLCGPEGMMDAAEAFLTAKGIGKAAIRRESFDLVLDDTEDDAPIDVTSSDDAGIAGECTELRALVAGENHTVNVKAGESLLAALLRAGADVPFSCQEGTCSSCIAKLRGGTVAVRQGILKTLRQEDLDEGLILACLAQPKTTSVSIDFDEI